MTLVAGILKTKGSEVFSIPPEITVLEATHELKLRRVGALLVCDEDRRIVGVLSERDIVRALADKGPEILDQPVSSLMTRGVVTCRSDDSIDSVRQLMTGRRIRHVPVIDDGELKGIISIGDVVKHQIMATEMEAEALKQYIATG